MDRIISLAVFLVTGAVAVSAYLFWWQRLKNQMGEKGFRSVVHCKIFYRDKELWKTVRAPGRQGIRFGFSDEDKYGNDVKIVKIIESKDMVDEKDIGELSVYATWFQILEVQRKLMVRPVYFPGENVLGHKKIYTDRGLLGDEGEKLGKELSIYGKRGLDSPWRILVYNEYYDDREGEEEEL